MKIYIILTTLLAALMLWAVQCGVAPAGGSVSLEPGGKHIMLINLKQELKPDEKISLTLNFEKAGPLTVEVEVRQSGAVQDHSHDHTEN